MYELFKRIEGTEIPRWGRQPSKLGTPSFLFKITWRAENAILRFFSKKTYTVTKK